MKIILTCILFLLIFSSCRAEEIESVSLPVEIEPASPIAIDFQTPNSWGTGECSVDERGIYIQEYCLYELEDNPSHIDITVQQYSTQSLAKQALSYEQHSVIFDTQRGSLPESSQESKMEICESPAYVYEHIKIPEGFIENNSHVITILFVHSTTLYSFHFVIDLVETNDPDFEISQIWQMIESVNCP